MQRNGGANAFPHKRVGATVKKRSRRPPPDLQPRSNVRIEWRGHSSITDAKSGWKSVGLATAEELKAAHKTNFARVIAAH